MNSTIESIVALRTHRATLASVISIEDESLSTEGSNNLMSRGHMADLEFLRGIVQNVEQRAYAPQARRYIEATRRLR